MGKCIDADKLMETIKAHHYPLVVKGLNSTDYGMFTLGIQQVVDEQSPVDAVEVVYCKDCVYSYPFDEEKLKDPLRVGEWRCVHWGSEMHEDDYCSCGKRRKNDLR